MKILIAVDESPSSQATVRWVCEHPWVDAARFMVLSVAEVPACSLVEPAGAGAYEGFEQEQARTSLTALARARCDLARVGLLAIEKVECGDPREVIIRVANAERSDLLVVGSHSRASLAQWLLGSVASHLVTHAPCSVLVIKSRPRKDGRKERMS